MNAYDETAMNMAKVLFENAYEHRLSAIVLVDLMGGFKDEKEVAAFWFGLGFGAGVEYQAQIPEERG